MSLNPGKIFPKLMAQELKYLIHAKVVLVMLLGSIALFGVVLWMNYEDAININDRFQWELENAKASGIDVEKELAAEYELTITPGLFTSTGSVTNPLAYDKACLEKAIYAASPAYTLTQLLEAGYWMVLPLVFGIFGLLVGAYDFSNRTIKMKGVRLSRSRYAVSKQLTMIIVSLVVFTVSLIVAVLLGKFMYSMLGQAIDVETYTKTFEQRSIIPKLLFSYIMGAVFMEVGYALGLLLKRTAAGIVIIIGYVYFLPVLGKIDPKSSIQVISSKIYDFYGVVTLLDVRKDITMFGAVLAVFVFFLIFMYIGGFIHYKRTMYE